jgi:hypothetical protein
MRHQALEPGCRLSLLVRFSYLDLPARSVAGGLTHCYCRVHGPAPGNRIGSERLDLVIGGTEGTQVVGDGVPRSERLDRCDHAVTTANLVRLHTVGVPDPRRTYPADANISQVNALPKEAEALLAVSPGEFVEERKRIARSLRDEGRREDADAVAALRKPPPVVLAANRAARDRPQAARAAAKAAERVAKTQLGSDPERYRAALAELDESLDLLAQVALAQLSLGGKRPTDSVTRRLRDLLRNAIADETARAALSRGVLADEPGTAGFGAFAGVAPSPSRRKAATRAAQRRKRADAKKREKSVRDELVQAEKTLAQARREEVEATRFRERAEQAVESIRTRLDRLRDEGED